jgi:ubiquinol-cytochrome c reductase cytochrome b/c1 subunit
VVFSRVLTAWYFIYLLIVLPLLGIFETPKPVPNSITEALKSAGKVVGVVLLAAGVGAAALIGESQPASAAEPAAKEHEAPPPPTNKWSFAGPFGKFDRGQLQRGFRVYHEVCKTCHGLSLVSFRTLGEEGGPEFTAAEVAAIAKEYKVKDSMPNDQGDIVERLARPGDYFPPPFPNEQAARFALRAVPPDMSVLAKARQYERGFPGFVFDVFVPYQELGVDYIVAILKGYAPKPADFKLADGLNYNTYFPNHGIAMTPPLSDRLVEYTDGAPQTVDQYAKDVAAFLMWAAEPSLEQRKRIGFVTLIFVLGLTTLLYLSKKKVWHGVDHPESAKTSA